MAIQMETFSNKLPDVLWMNILEQVHPMTKGLFTGDLPCNSTSRKAVSFQQGVESFSQRSGDFVNCKWVQIFSFDSTSDQNPRSNARDRKKT